MALPTVQTTSPPGYVSLFHLLSRDESGSSAQFSHNNNDAKGNSFLNLLLYTNTNAGNYSDHFKHGFNVIGPTGAKIWPFKGLSKILFRELPSVK